MQSVPREWLDFLRQQFPKDSRIQLTEIGGNPRPISPGSTGKLDYIDDAGQFHVKWDNGCTLALVLGEDRFSVYLPEPQTFKLYMPLTADFYGRDEWGDMSEDGEEWDGHTLMDYEGQILSALVKNRVPEENESGLMRWYAELGGEIKDIYVCQSNETACFHRSDAPVVLEVRKGFFNDPSYDNDKTAVLNLPAADAGIWRAVEKVDAASVDECAFRCVDCLIPFLRDAINNAIDDEDGIEQADEFAKRLAQIEREWPESDMVKYKALLSVVDHPSLQDATRLMGEIDQYELRPEVAQTWGYAEMMFREKYSALPEELFQTPQAAQIGQKMLDDRLGVITEYGLIRRKDGQPLPVFQPEQEIGQGLEMM